MASLLCFEEPNNYDDRRLAGLLRMIYDDPHGDVENLAGYTITKELERRGFDALVAAFSGELKKIDKANSGGGT